MTASLGAGAHADLLLAGSGYENSTTFTEGQFEMMFAASAFAMFALFAGMLYNLQTRREVGVKYRASATTSAVICGVAFLSYVVINLSWITGFDFVPGQGFVPQDNPFQFRNGYRYIDWSVTVPLLTAEFLAVLGLVGARARNTRAVLMTAAFAMIVTGFLGAEILGNPNNDGQRILWGSISTVFWLVVLARLIPAVRQAATEVPEETGQSMRNALILLLVCWSVYPILYLVPLGWFPNSQEGAVGHQEWAVIRQILFSVTDVAAKVGFGALIHKIAKMRTAEDVNAGEETHPEAVYLSHDKLAEPRPPVAIVRNDGDGEVGGQREERGAVHGRERRHPGSRRLT